MGVGFVERSLDFTRKKKKWIVVIGLIGFSSYGMYTVYHMPFLARKRRRILNLIGSLVSMAQFVSDSAETLTVISKDLRKFLQSDLDEIPNSLKQLSKIARSEEFSQSVAIICQAMTVGVLGGYNGGNTKSEIIEADRSRFSDRIMDKLMSKAGTGFVSVVVGSFARNLVLGFYSNAESDRMLSSSSGSSLSPMWVNVLSDNRCRAFIADCIQNFVSTAVTVYLDKTMEINFIDEVLTGVTDPKYQNKVTDIMVSLCNGAVETLVKTTHQVMTTSKQGPSMGSDHSISIVEDSEINEYTDLKKNGWVNSVSSTLAVPSNRKFVLDVTGRVTFETVRSVTEFLLSKICESLKRSLNVAHDEIVGRGFEMVRYVGAKSSVILTVFLALLLHFVANSRALLLQE